jgi:hypothetical protein|tara:strand:+ start:206 stop:349 length:144 start_codon:yes stop_codon:yes gene_type:complete
MDIDKRIKKLVADFRLTHAMNEQDCRSLETKISWLASEIKMHCMNKT